MERKILWIAKNVVLLQNFFEPFGASKINHGKVLEWLKRPAWKASKR